jgi:hypothetical protein
MVNSIKPVIFESNPNNKITLSTNKSVPNLEYCKNITQGGKLLPKKRRNTEHLENNVSFQFIEQTLSFQEFRKLLSTTNSDPIDWEFESLDDGNEITILETEYHIIRQILMILNRQLDDMGTVFQSLRKFPTFEIIHFLGQTPHREVDKPFKYEQKRDTGTELSDHDHKILFSSSNIRSEETERQEHNIDVEFGMEEEELFRGKTFGNPNTINAKVKAIKGVSKQNIIYFLERNNVQFLPEDVLYIFKAFGCSEEILRQNNFDAVMFNKVWNI